MKEKTTLRELLNTPYLKGISRVLAGENNLDRQVDWVHILEVHDIASQYVDGGELVLATSKGFSDKSVALRYLQELIDKNVAGLCLDTTLYYPKIDEELVELAKANDFPLIHLYQFSRFIDISRGLNTIILNQKSALYRNADRYDAALAAMSISASIEDKVRYTAEYLNLEAAFLPADEKPFYTAPEMKLAMQPFWADAPTILKETEIWHHGNLMVKDLYLFHKVYGYLAFYSGRRKLSEFDEIILSRLTINIRNILINEMKEKEMRLLQHHDWIGQWLSGSLDEGKIRTNLRKLGYIEKFDQFYVCSILPRRLNPSSPEDEPAEYAMLNTFIAGLSVLFRKAYEDENLIALTYVKDPVITYIIPARSADLNLERRIETAVRKMQESENPYIDFDCSIFSVGKKVYTYTDVKRSMDTSLQLLQSPDLAEQGLVFFDRLYLKQIFREIDRPGLLDHFAEDHLGSLLLPENEVLLHTLKTYYSCSCSKQKTAEILFIARPTLYARLKKIETLLGPGFDQGEKRLACEFAIHAHTYLNS